MSGLTLAGDTSGSITLNPPAIAGNTTINLPTISGGSFVVSDSSGNVGIGTNSPSTRLEVNGNARIIGNRIYQGNTGGNDFEIGAGAGTGDTTVWGFYAPASRSISLLTGAAERMRITSAGSVGIGTVTPSVYQGNASLGLAVGTIRGLALISEYGGQGIYGSGITFNASATTNITPNTFTVLSGTAQRGGAAIFVDYNGNFLFHNYDAGAETGGTRTVNLSTTERMRLDTSGNLLFNSGYGSVATAYGCRAWVNFDGSAASLTARAQGNVSSITDNGVGLYTVNFTTAMPDSNYAAVVRAKGAANGVEGGSSNSTYATGSVQVNCFRSDTGANNDPTIVTVAIFR